MGERQGETLSTREMRKGNPCLTFTGRGLARGKAEFPRWEDSLSQGQLGGSQEAGMREGRNEGGQDMGAVISRRCSKLTHLGEGKPSKSLGQRVTVCIYIYICHAFQTVG